MEIEIMNVTLKDGTQTTIEIDSKKQIATVNGRITHAIRDNKVKVWNCDVLNTQSNTMVKNEMQRQFVKTVEQGKKRK